ncbi:Rz1-like lysis system protein LysC [Serratia rubidaea]|uniref:Rz1-like lysis system protein LysC n=1 Tax=Serratia rubidaea TaxID=61652 RepID=UPI003FA3D267
MTAPGALLLALSLTSCAERTPQPLAPIVLLPPESVFTPCEQPKLQGDTWGISAATCWRFKQRYQSASDKLRCLTPGGMGFIKNP